MACIDGYYALTLDSRILLLLIGSRIVALLFAALIKEDESCMSTFAFFLVGHFYRPTRQDEHKGRRLNGQYDILVQRVNSFALWTRALLFPVGQNEQRENCDLKLKDEKRREDKLA